MCADRDGDRGREFESKLSRKAVVGGRWSGGKEEAGFGVGYRRFGTGLWVYFAHVCLPGAITLCHGNLTASLPWTKQPFLFHWNLLYSSKHTNCGPSIVSVLSLGAAHMCTTNCRSIIWRNLNRL